MKFQKSGAHDNIIINNLMYRNTDVAQLGYDYAPVPPDTNPSYPINNTISYAYFYDWCHEQVGFGKVDDKGRYWQLDKDLLFVGNKTYSETTCVFVPNEINLFFNNHGNARGEYPLGVSFHKRIGKYVAQCW